MSIKCHKELEAESEVEGVPLDDNMYCMTVRCENMSLRNLLNLNILEEADAVAVGVADAAALEEALGVADAANYFIHTKFGVDFA